MPPTTSSASAGTVAAIAFVCGLLLLSGWPPVAQSGGATAAPGGANSRVPSIGSPHAFVPIGAHTVRAAPASSPLTWWDITSESSRTLPVFWFTQGTWDAADGYLLFYGGDDFAGNNLADTWSFSGGSWKLMAPSGAPGPLDGPALAYDPNASAVVMYGGLSSYAPFTYTSLTWRYSAGAWTSAQLSPTPPPRLAATMVYDPDLGGVVLFGGYNNSDPSGNTLLNDSWLYKQGAWSRLPATTTPPVRTWPSLAYDPSLHELVLYSGIGPANSCTGDTWTYAGGTWTKVAVPTGGPVNLCATTIGYDPDVGHVVLTGGFNVTAVPNNATWEFTGSAWVPLAPTGLPAPHEYGVSAWDPIDHGFVVAGGWPSQSFTNFLSPVFSVVNVAGPATSEVGQPVQFHITAAGGVPHRSYHWTWGDGWTTSGGPSTNHTYTSPGTYTITANATDATGKTGSATTSIQVVVGPVPQISPSTSVGEVGVPVNFSSTIVGGSGTDTYAWTFGDGSSAIGSPVNHTYGTAGTYPVSLRVADGVGGSGSTKMNYVIDPALSVRFMTTAVGEAGFPMRLNATVTGGIAPISYLWTFDDGGVSTSVNATHTFAATGVHLVNLTVKDSFLVVASARSSPNIAAPLGLIITGTGSLSAGATGSWTVNVTNGVQPYRDVFWILPDGSRINGTTASFQFNRGGFYTVEVSATDAAGATAISNETVTVTGTSGVFGGSIAGVPTVLLAGAVAAIALAAIAAVIFMRRRPASPAPEE